MEKNYFIRFYDPPTQCSSRKREQQKVECNFNLTVQVDKSFIFKAFVPILAKLIYESLFFFSLLLYSCNPPTLSPFLSMRTQLKRIDIYIRSLLLRSFIFMK